MRQYTNEAIIKRKNTKIKIKKYISIFVYIILIPLLIYNISLIFQAILKPNETPSFLGIKTYVIISGSMQPELNIGDVVVVKKVAEEKMQIGDIISFREGQNVITHRIIDIAEENENKLYKTKGDNNNSEDKTVISIDKIEGKVYTSIPYIGKIAILLQGKITLIIIIIIFYGYFVRSEKMKNKREARRLKRLEYEKGMLENEEK